MEKILNNCKIIFYKNYKLLKIGFKYEKTFDDILKILNKISKEMKFDKGYTMSIHFVNSEQIRELNNKYRKINKLTDVLSFPFNDFDDNEWYIGDVFINEDIIVKQAEEIGSEPETEIKFLSMHGILHLVGFDHITKEQEDEMTFKQRKIFNELGIRDDKVI